MCSLPSQLHACLFDLGWLAGSLIEYSKVFSDLGKEKEIKKKREEFFIAVYIPHQGLTIQPVCSRGLGPPESKFRSYPATLNSTHNTLATWENLRKMRFY